MVHGKQYVIFSHGNGSNTSQSLTNGEPCTGTLHKYGTDKSRTPGNLHVCLSTDNGGLTTATIVGTLVG